MAKNDPPPSSGKPSTNSTPALAQPVQAAVVTVIDGASTSTGKVHETMDRVVEGLINKTMDVETANAIITARKTSIEAAKVTLDSLRLVKDIIGLQGLQPKPE
jgi:hypothetical protein